jgi:hypothetical protein
MPTFTVATTATKLADSSSDDRRITLHNRSAVIVYADKTDGVTTANGTQVAAGAQQEFSLEPGEQLFGIVATGTAAVDVF